MAGPLAAIERFFERLFERPPARLFAARVEQEQLVRQLQRAMEAERRVHRQRTYAPAAYHVRLNRRDLEALGDPAVLAASLGEALRTHARSRGYILPARPAVVLEPGLDIPTGEIVVVAGHGAAPASMGSAGARPAADAGDARAAESAAGSSLPEPGAEARPVDGHTAVFEAARPRVPSATIAVHVPGHDPWRVPVTGGRVRVGRALDNDIVLPDDRVSRHHGQINVRFGTLVYSDLGSTNGSFVNGARVSDIALGPTDVLMLGRSSLTIERGQ